MRVMILLLSVAVAGALGCSSKTSGGPGRDASSPDAASDLPPAPPDGVSSDRNDTTTPTDLAVTSDAPPAADATLASDPAPKADLDRADLAPAPGDASGDTSTRADVASTPDTTSKLEVASTPDTTPKLEVASTPDTTPRLDVAPAPDAVPADVALADTAAPADLARPEAGTDVTAPATGRVLGGCQILPANHIFNTPIDNLPVHASSAAFMTTIGNRNIHLDLGTSVDMASAEYYGIPYNPGDKPPLVWTAVRYSSTDPDMGWDPYSESDCVDQSSGSAHTIISPCSASKAPKPWLPMPAAPLVEGGIVTDPTQPYGDHHMLVIDPSVCRLWELYHCYPNTSGGWDIFGSATWDLGSNALRPADWTSADAAGFPILPLLLLEKEASSGEIKHALRFTISSSSIRNQYVWPARHLTSNGTMSASLPPMGQLFRIKASYQIPSTYSTQSRAILQALKTYGMYIADGGSNMYIQGDPSAAWQDSTFSQVQSVGSSQFEAVDLAPIMNRSGFDANSAAVPPP